jgi:HlyD family secretion protein
MKTRLLVAVLTALALMAVVWGARRVIRLNAAGARAEIPTTPVKKGRVVITVTARGELQGGNSEALTAPMAGGGDMAITYLRQTGELVQPGDVVARFDTQQQEFTLREAEDDLAEAEQQVIRAQADAEAALEEARYQLLSTNADVKVAELEVRKNPVLAGIVARQNEIALEAARNRQKQAERDLNNKKTTGAAGIEIQKAAVEKAKIAAQTARTTIDSMVLKAKTHGYVAIQINSNQNSIYYGQTLPPFEMGDTARAGQSIAQIPDMSEWEVSARIPEADRGHLQAGQKVAVRVAAVPGRTFSGHVKSVGASAGSAWERTFDCRIAMEDRAPELRPGMTSNISITVETLDDVLWVPAQAVFESDGRPFVYLRSPDGFTPHDVQVVRRSESQAVIGGIDQGVLVALSRPEEQRKSNDSQPAGVMKALGK